MQTSTPAVWRIATPIEAGAIHPISFGPEASPLPFSETFTAKASNAQGPAGFPAGPWGETPFFSERDLVVAVNQLGVLTFGGLRAAQKIDLFRDDLAAVAVGPGSVGPFGVVDAAVDQNLHALCAMLGDRLAKTVEASDAVPFGIHHAVAVLVALDPAFREARPRGGKGEVGDCGAALRGACFWGLTDVACEDDDVLHGVVSNSLVFRGTIPFDKTRKKTVGFGLHGQRRSRRPDNPEGRDGAGSRGTRQHGPA